jgi:hypothetical protein
MASSPVTTLFASEITAGIDFFFGGKNTVDFDPLSTNEELAVQKCWRKNISFIQDVSANIGAQLAAQETVMVKMAGVAKAVFPELKTVNFPGIPGGITADFITPQSLFWVRNPQWGGSSTSAAAGSGATGTYTDYGAYSDESPAGTYCGGVGLMNTFDVVLTAGTPVYLFGGTPGAASISTQFYNASQVTEAHSFSVLAADGLIEIGTTPKLSHLVQNSQVQNMYSPIAFQPMVDLPLSGGQNLYQYNTVGVTPLMHNFGMQLAVLPKQSGKSNLRWMGMSFYEYNFLPTIAGCWMSQ